MARTQSRRSPDAASETRGRAAPIEVEVRSRLDGEWCRGFAVEEVDVREDGSEWFRVRRTSDDRLLPEWFSADDVIAERHAD